MRVGVKGMRSCKRKAGVVSPVGKEPTDGPEAKRERKRVAEIK